MAIKNRNLYTILLISALLILGIVFYAVHKKNQFKKKQLQKEIDLKDALATIKTQNRLQEQRLRISRDLHDNIGSQLTFIISSIDNLKFISKDANQKLKDKLSNICQAILWRVFLYSEPGLPSPTINLVIISPDYINRELTESLLKVL